jgi:hypothetical protein
MNCTCWLGVLCVESFLWHGGGLGLEGKRWSAEKFGNGNLGGFELTHLVRFQGR